MQVALRLPTVNHHVDGLLLRADGELCLLDHRRRGQLGLVGINLRQVPLDDLERLCRIEVARPEGEPLDVRLYTPELDYSVYTLKTPEELPPTPANHPATAFGGRLGPVPQLRFSQGLAGVPALFDEACGVYPARLLAQGWCQMEPEYGDVVIADAAFHRQFARAWESWTQPTPLGPRSRLSALAGD